MHLGNDIQYIQKLIEAGISYEYNVFPRKTHSVSGADDRSELYGAVLEHFERYLLHPAPEKAAESQ